MEAALASIGLLSPATVTRANGRLARFETLDRQHARRAAAGGQRRVLEVGGGHGGGDRRARAARAGGGARAGRRRLGLDPDLRGAVGALLRRRARARAVGARRHARRRARPRVGVRHLDVVRAARADRAAARRRDRRRAGGAHRGRCCRGCRTSCARRCSACSRRRWSRAATSTAPSARSRESGCGPSLPEFVCLNPAFHARGLLRLAQGRHEAALADFTEFGERSARIALRNPGDPWRLGAAECLLRLDCPDGGGGARRRAARARAALGHAVGDRHRAARPGARARRRRRRRSRRPPRCSRARSARLDHARCLVDLGAALRRANQRAAAREPLREGLELARRCGADGAVAARPRRARGRRRPAAAADVQRPGRAHAERAPRGRARRRRDEQPRHRAAAVRDDQDGRQPPRAGLRQARDLLARRARGRASARRQAEISA